MPCPFVAAMRGARHGMDSSGQSARARGKRRDDYRGGLRLIRRFGNEQLEPQKRNLEPPRHQERLEPQRHRDTEEILKSRDARLRGHDDGGVIGNSQSRDRERQKPKVSLSLYICGSALRFSWCLGALVVKRPAGLSLFSMPLW